MILIFHFYEWKKLSESNQEFTLNNANYAIGVMKYMHGIALSLTINN